MSDNERDDIERRIDEALAESFPSSDPPFYVGAGCREGRYRTTEGNSYRATQATEAPLDCVGPYSSGAGAQLPGTPNSPAARPATGAPTMADADHNRSKLRLNGLVAGIAA